MDSLELKHLVNLVGQTFGELRVIGHIGWERRQTVWRCQCSCGQYIRVRGTDLLRGHTKSCGHRASRIGQHVGTLTVLKEAGRDKSRRVLYECRCDCQSVCVVSSKTLALDPTCPSCRHRAQIRGKLDRLQWERSQREEAQLRQSELKSALCPCGETFEYSGA